MSHPFENRASSSGYFASPDLFAQAYPAGSTLSSGLSMPSMRMPALHHSEHHSDLVLRSLYPASSAPLGGSSGFEPPAVVYRSMATMAPQPEAPFQFAAAQPVKSADYTLQQPHFSTSKFTLPQSTLESAAVATAAPARSTGASDGPSTMPGWVEPHSHFFCNCPSPVQLWETVEATLRLLHEMAAADAEADGIRAEPSRGTRKVHVVDCHPQTERFLLQCTAYHADNGAGTPFVVRVYSIPQHRERFCVEFSKVKPCDFIHFLNIVAIAKERIQAAHPDQQQQQQQQQQQLNPHLQPPTLSKHQLVAPALVMPSLYCFSAPPLPSEIALEAPSQSSVCETVRSLLNMCEAECFTTRLHAVLALADMSATAAAEGSSLHEVLVNEGCHQIFLQHLLLTEDTDLHRASLTALVNLAATQATVCDLVIAEERYMDKCLQLASEQPKGNAHRARECARFLANAAEALGSKLLQRIAAVHRSRFPAVVAQLVKHADAHCRRHGKIIAQKIGLQEIATA